MKTKILFLALIMLIGCNSQKKLTENVSQKQIVSTDVKSQAETTHAQTTQAQAIVQTTADSQRTAIKTEDRQEVTTVHTINYGTNQAKQSETIQTTTIGIVARSSESENDTYSQAEVNTLFATYFEQAKTTNDSLRSEVRTIDKQLRQSKTQASHWWLWLLAGAIIVIGIQLAWRYTPLGKLSFVVEKIKRIFV